MKLSELSTDEALDVMCMMTPHIMAICTDEELEKEIREKIKADENSSRAELMLVAIDKINRIIPVVLKKHRANVYSILSALNGKNVEDIAKQNIIKTMEQIREVVKDKDLMSFFKSCAASESSE